MKESRTIGATMPEVRAWAVARLGPPEAGTWATGAVSAATWALLMAPMPGDADETAWLADSVGIGRGELAALLGADSPSAPGVP